MKMMFKKLFKAALVIGLSVSGNFRCESSDAQYHRE